MERRPLEYATPERQPSRSGVVSLCWAGLSLVHGVYRYAAASASGSTAYTMYCARAVLCAGLIGVMIGLVELMLPRQRRRLRIVIGMALNVAVALLFCFALAMLA
jgi:ABC-type uncharacterized transport system permease subunit